MVENKMENKKTEDKKEEHKPVEKETGKTEIKEKPKKAEKIVKEVAIANAYSVRISPKQSFAICKVLKGKSPENGIKRLEDVINHKRAIPMASREVAHQKGKGIAGAKFPENACKEIIDIIKQVGANAIVAGIENPIITVAKADRASRPFKSDGRRGKRTHIHLEVRDKLKISGAKK